MVRYGKYGYQIVQRDGGLEPRRSREDHLLYRTGHFIGALDPQMGSQLRRIGGGHVDLLTLGSDRSKLGAIPPTPLQSCYHREAIMVYVWVGDRFNYLSDAGCYRIPTGCNTGSCVPLCLECIYKKRRQKCYVCHAL